MAAWQKWNLDTSRHQRELIPSAEYLRMSYYEKWIAGLIELLVKTGLVTGAEIESGKPAPGLAKGIAPLTRDKVFPLIAQGNPATRDIAVLPRFQAGQRVRARNMHSTGHTRLPRYTRGKLGTVDCGRGIFVFPDTNAHFLGEKPQHLYSVRFAASELWG